MGRRRMKMHINVSPGADGGFLLSVFDHRSVRTENRNGTYIRQTPQGASQLVNELLVEMEAEREGAKEIPGIKA